MSEWNPIDTAPKDGTQILLFFPEYENPIQVGYYAIAEQVLNGVVIERDEYWKGKWMEFRFIRHSIDGEDHPTHWMPLPAVPLAVSASKFLAMSDEDLDD